MSVTNKESHSSPSLSAKLKYAAQKCIRSITLFTPKLHNLIQQREQCKAVVVLSLVTQFMYHRIVDAVFEHLDHVYFENDLTLFCVNAGQDDDERTSATS